MITASTVISYAKLPLTLADVACPQAPITASWQPHFNTRHYEGSWEVLPLRSPEGQQDLQVAELIGHADFKDTVYLKHFPEIERFLNALNCPLMSVRLLNLKAGAVIKEHRDYELAFELGEARLHIPLFTNPEVEFVLQGQRINMQVGECWYINANLPHRVTNGGKTDRIHLVIDCQVNNWLQSVFEVAEKAYHTEQANREQLLLMLRELQNQPGETAQALAAQIEQQIKAGEATHE